MYKIKELSKLAGVSTRTLRHYDTIGLLIPSRNEATYRLYNEDDVDRLQTILFYKELGYELKEIKELLNSNDFSIIHSLQSLESKLEHKIEQYYQMLESVQTTIQYKKGVINMTNKDKFEAFKEQTLTENTKQYGEELNQKYNQEFIKQANEKYKRKSQYELKQHEAFTKEMHQVMKDALIEGNPKSDLAVKMCEMHKEWIMFYWPSYSKEAHLGLCKMYTEDERFKKHYDKIQNGLADFLYISMQSYLK